MDYKYINQLLDRYWKCETTLEEERILRTFFSQDSLPEELCKYREIFLYEQTEPQNDTLGSEFDERVLSIIGEPERKQVVAVSLTLTQRLMPLFKAAAVVAIILTLGNAAQVPFQDQGYSGTVNSTHPIEGVSVAMGGDSTRIDTLQQSSINMMVPETTPILK